MLDCSRPPECDASRLGERHIFHSPDLHIPDPGSRASDKHRDRSDKSRVPDGSRFAPCDAAPHHEGRSWLLDFLRPPLTPTDLIPRRPRSGRLEGWQRIRCEMVRDAAARLLTMRGCGLLLDLPRPPLRPTDLIRGGRAAAVSKDGSGFGARWFAVRGAASPLLTTPLRGSSP